MRGDLEVQRQGGQVVADHVVQFARDAHALRNACVIGQQGLRVGVRRRTQHMPRRAAFDEVPQLPAG